MKCIWLYGYSSCVHEEYDNFGNRISIDRNSEEIEKAARNIETVSNLLQETEGPLNLISVLSMIFQCIKVPCVAIGVLRWVEATTTPKYLEKQVEGTPVSLALVDEGISLFLAYYIIVIFYSCHVSCGST
jgi:negative elongation factor C/D